MLVGFQGSSSLFELEAVVFIVATIAVPVTFVWMVVALISRRRRRGAQA